MSDSQPKCKRGRQRVSRARGGRRYKRRRSGGGAGGGSPGRLSPAERFPRRLPPPAAPSICIGVACTSRTLAGLVPTGFLCYLCVPFGGDRREIFTMARASGWLLWRPGQRSCKEEPRSSFGFLLALLVRILLLVLPFFVCSPLPLLHSAASSSFLLVFSPPPSFCWFSFLRVFSPLLPSTSSSFLRVYGLFSPPPPTHQHQLSSLRVFFFFVSEVEITLIWGARYSQLVRKTEWYCFVFDSNFFFPILHILLFYPHLLVSPLFLCFINSISSLLARFAPSSSPLIYPVYRNSFFLLFDVHYDRESILGMQIPVICNVEGILQGCISAVDQ